MFRADFLPFTSKIVEHSRYLPLVPADKLGRVSSFDNLGSLCLLPVAYALGGVLTDRNGPAWVFIAGGLMNVVLPLIALSVREVRHLE